MSVESLLYMRCEQHVDLSQIQKDTDDFLMIKAAEVELLL